MAYRPFLSPAAEWGGLSGRTAEKRFVTNFSASRRPAFEKAIADLNLGQVLEIRDDATDSEGRRVPELLALYRLESRDLSLFWEKIKQ